MRKRISEQNILPNFSVKDEHDKLETIFRTRGSFGAYLGIGSKTHPYLSYEDCLKSLFLDWPLRGSFTSYDEMLQNLKIDDVSFSTFPTEDQLLDYVQFLLNAVRFVDSYVSRDKSGFYKAGNTNRLAIEDNATLILNHLKAEAKIDKRSKEVFVIYKDDVASAIAVTHADLNVSIIEYLKIDNRGDLQRKGEVLCTLAKKLEPHEQTLIKNGFQNLCKDTTYLLNHIGARHYQNPNKSENVPFVNMDNVEAEKWYDRTFEMFLACMAVLPYAGYKDEVNTLKSGQSV